MKTHLGHYEIESELGRGGMGVVYKAFEPALNRHVAIKELSPALAHDPQLVERFLREARSMASLSDPHIIQIFYIGTDESTSQPFFSMEYIEGDSLSTLIKRDGKIGLENALKILHQTAQGLAAAHDRGVIHRDIKPGNLMITHRGQVKIADFGIALAAQDISRKLTSTGEFVGTPGYLSPEVCLGKPVDQRSDIFSLGIVLFEMLTGKTPFNDESPLGLMLEVVKTEFPDIQALNDSVDAQTAAILARMVAKEPGERFQSCHDLAASLEAHPLVAKGGTISISRPAALTDGATVVGAPTPLSSPRQVTPPPVVRAGTGSNAAPAVPPTPATPAAQATIKQSHPAPRSRSLVWIPLTAAAAMVLMVAGGAFAFRGQIMDFVRGFGDGFIGHSEVAYEAGRNTGKASNPIGTSSAAASSMNSRIDTDVDMDSGAASFSSPATAASSLDDMAADAQQAIEQDRAAPLNTDSAITLAASSPPAMAAGSVSSNAAPVAAPTMPESSQAQVSHATDIATKATAQTDAPAPAVVAKRTPPPAPAAPPAPPRIALITAGDTALADPARAAIERDLIAAGFDVISGEALGADGLDLSAALNAVRREASVAIVIRAEPQGSEQLKFYGRVSEMYTASLSVRAYKTADRASLGGGLSEKVQFTHLNAETQAQSAVSGKLNRLIAELSPYRRRG